MSCAGDYEDDPPLTLIALAVRAGVAPSLREFLDMPESWREAWANVADNVAATRATLMGLAAQGPLGAAFVLAGAGSVEPLLVRTLQDEHARALEAEKGRLRA